MNHDYYHSLDPEDITSIAVGFEKTADLKSVLNDVLNDARIPVNFTNNAEGSDSEIPLTPALRIHVCKTLIEACKSIISDNTLAAIQEGIDAGEVGKWFSVLGIDNVRFVLEVKDVISLKGKRGPEALTWRKAYRLQKQLAKESKSCTAIMYDAFQDFKESHPRFTPESTINIRCLSVVHLDKDSEEAPSVQSDQSVGE